MTTNFTKTSNFLTILQKSEQSLIQKYNEPSFSSTISFLFFILLSTIFKRKCSVTFILFINFQMRKDIYHHGHASWNNSFLILYFYFYLLFWIICMHLMCIHVYSESGKIFVSRGTAPRQEEIKHRGYVLRTYLSQLINIKMIHFHAMRLLFIYGAMSYSSSKKNEGHRHNKKNCE